jgi:hypothetical protein
MGKENDGVMNDNLYGGKLDAFLMECWRACRPALKANASAYIWGNAESLWRLWYRGGLADSGQSALVGVWASASARPAAAHCAGRAARKAVTVRCCTTHCCAAQRSL